MKNAVILHGKPTRERYENPDLPKPHKANWLPWLADQLRDKGISAIVPALPKPYFPIYTDWKSVFEKHHIDEQTALIGHSAGSEFILRWLSETGTAVGQVVLVAPYHDFERKYGDFSEFKLDKNIVQRIKKFTIFNSLDDDPPIQKNVLRITKVLPGIKLRQFENYGHFRIGHNMTGPEFPELLEELI